MAIRVEFIKRRPGGRITVRPTVYDNKELTLGRATDCNIHLPDLRVGLHHARLTRLSAAKIRIEALGDLRVRVDGAPVRRRELTLNQADNIRIGPYQLSAKASDTEGDILICVELVEAPTTVGDTSDEDELFSMRGYAPGRRSSAWVLGLTIAIAFLALPIVAYFTLRGGKAPQTTAEKVGVAATHNWLAGDLSSVHANLGADCASCHEQPFVRVKDEACLSCHDETHNHADADRLTTAMPFASGSEIWLAGVREALDIPEGRCGSCHFEHNGPQGVIPTSSTSCTDCHADMDQRLTDTELVNVINFDKWHPEFKPNAIIDPHEATPQFHRVSLVDQPTENNGLTFPHDFHLGDDEVTRKLQTLGPNAGRQYGDALECADCHQIETGGALFRPIEMERDCGACHSLAFAAEENSEVRYLPHGEPEEVRATLEDFYLAQATQLLLGDRASDILDQQLSAEARARREELRQRAFNDAQSNTQAMIERIFSPDGVCQKCHINEVPDDATPRLTPVRLTSRYMPNAEFSHEAHMTGDIECADCHRAETSSESADILMPGITTCRTCHADTSQSGAIASDCLTCHIYHNDGENAPLMTPARTRAARIDWSQ